MELPVRPSGPTSFPEPSNQRQIAVRDAFKFAWKNYKEYAWGRDHLKPISKGFSEWMECGLTIVDSLDTILIMNLKDGKVLTWIFSIDRVRGRQKVGG